MDALTFYAGDQDFRPLIEAVVREGMYVTLRYGAISTSPELINASDAHRELGYYELHEICTESFKNKHPLASTFISTPMNKDETMALEIAAQQGEDVAWIYQDATLGYVMETLEYSQDNNLLFYTSKDIEALKRAYRFCHSHQNEAAWRVVPSWYDSVEWEDA